MYIAIGCLGLVFCFTMSCKLDAKSAAQNKTKSTAVHAPLASFFKAKINGKSWVASKQEINYKEGYLYISGKSSDGTQINIQLKPMEGYETISDYYLSYASSTEKANCTLASKENFNTEANGENKVDKNNYSCPSFVSIKEYNKTQQSISGSFTIIATDAQSEKKLCITDGEFSISKS